MYKFKTCLCRFENLITLTLLKNYLDLPPFLNRFSLALSLGRFRFSFFFARPSENFFS